MTKQEAAWFAGFFDGEGSIGLYRRSNGKRGWRFSVPNVFRPALVQCKKLTGVGKIKAKYVAHDNIQDQFEWYLYAQRDIAAICKQILPFLTVKRKKVKAFLKQWKDV
jgi:hypothetical protein